MLFKEACGAIMEESEICNKVRIFVCGDWQRGTDANEVAKVVVNPATEQHLTYVYGATHAQIDTAFEAARISQEYWHYDVGEQEKATVFQQVTAYLEEIRGELAWVMIQEAGKLWRWAEAEVQEAIDTVLHYHGEISRMYGRYSRCQMPDKAAIAMREPYGVILGITPWNFPLAVPSWKIFAALAGGNAIVVKGAEQTPTTLSLLCYLVHRAIADTLGRELAGKLGGIFQVLHGKGEMVGKYALEKGDYDKVMFTGSTETGRVVGEIAGRRLKPVSLELGGHAAMILLDDFDMDRAVEEAVNANCGDSGQRCVSARAVFVQENVSEAFVRAYTKRVRTLHIGDPADHGTFMGPLISKKQLQRVDDGVRRAIADGGKCVVGGYTLRSAGSPRVRKNFPHTELEACNYGYYYAPTVIRVDTLQNYAMQNEIFGPVLCVMPVAGNNRKEVMENAVQLMNASRYGLSNSVLTNELPLAMWAIERVKTGIFYVGRGTTGAEVGQYFGGVKDSGHGREGCGLDEVTYIKQVYIDYHGKPRMAQAGDERRVQKLLAESEQAGRSIFH